MKQKKIIDSEYIKEFYEKYKKGHKVNVAKLYYQGVFGFRKAGVKYSYSFEEMEEWSKCKHDPIYFIEKYCDIFNIGLAKFTKVKLYDYQKELINDFFKYRFNITLTSRQTGISTVTCFIILHQLCFESNKNTFYLHDKIFQSVEILNKIKELYKRLPYFLKPGVVLYNKKIMKFENGNNMYCIYPSPASIHMTEEMDNVFIGDCAFIKKMKEINSVLIPRISSNFSRLFIHSAINGYNQFYETYIDALETNNLFKPHRIHWSQVPGRNEEWKRIMIRNIGEDAFNKEFELKLNLKK